MRENACGALRPASVLVNAAAQVAAHVCSIAQQTPDLSAEAKITSGIADKSIVNLHCSLTSIVRAFGNVSNCKHIEA
jgi:hypothetical protein